MYTNVQQHKQSNLCLSKFPIQHIYIYVNDVIQCVVRTPSYPRREAGDLWCLPPVWNLRALSLIPLFYLSSFVFLPSPVAFSVLFVFAFWPIFLTSFSLNLHFVKGRFFFVAHVVFFLSGYESCFVRGMCSIFCHMALVCVHLSIYIVVNLRWFWSILFYNIFNLAFKRQTETVNGTSIF